jgi:hypothetical protein
VAWIGTEELSEMEWAEQTLANHDIFCELKVIDVINGQSVGEQLLADARNFNADWLVSRIRSNSCVCW